LSATLRFSSSASIAETQWLAVEFNNTSGRPLEISQVWIHVNGECQEPSTHKYVQSGGIADLNYLTPALKPLNTGVVTVAFGSTVSLPSPRAGFVVKAIVQGQVSLEHAPVGDTSFEIPREGVPISFTWRYPNADEFESMRAELKHLLLNPKYESPHSTRLLSLFAMQEVAESMSLDDLLPALKRREGSMDGRDQISRQLAKRFSDAPMLRAYYHEARASFQESLEKARRDGTAEPYINRTPWWDDLVPHQVWKAEFAEFVLARYEAGDVCVGIDKFVAYREQWIADPQYVARLSAAFLKHQPILSRDVKKLSGKKLPDWYEAALEAAALRDTNIVKLLEPALRDKRTLEIDLGSGGKFRVRVCDHAVEAILEILDGDSWLAFAKAGISGWTTDREGRAAHDRVILELRKRLAH